ncbi:MAG: DUF6666 family protein, partial [Pirellulales bacterium]
VGAGIAQAQHLQLTPNHDEAGTALTNTIPAGRQSCGKCGGSNCEECRGLFNECRDCRRISYFAFTGFDSWRGVADGSYQDNHGVHTGLNAGGPLWEDYGLGWQLGGSFGIYDWNGRLSSFDENDESSQQAFVTAGLFRRAGESSRWSGGMVLDQMAANNFGVLSNEPYLLQLRYQLAFAFSTRNELGFWATNELNHDSQSPSGIPIVNRAVNQANIFWHHKYDVGADTWFYLGVPTNGRVGPPGFFDEIAPGADAGTLGDFVFGGMLSAPFNDRLAAYGNFAYLNPTADPVVAAEEESFNVSIGLAWYPGGNARSRTVAGRTWMPYLPVANNGTFLIDQNITF